MDTEKFTRALADQIKAERAIAGLTQKELAAVIGVGPASMQRYEAGERELPVTVLMRIAEALDVPPAKLFERSTLILTATLSLFICGVE